MRHHRFIARLVVALVLALRALGADAADQALAGYPIQGLDPGLEEMRSFWTGPQAPCAQVPGSGVGRGALLGGIMGAAVGYGLTGSVKAAAGGAVVGAGAGALWLRNRNPAAGTEQAAMALACQIASTNAKEVGYFADMLALDFGQECGIARVDFNADAAGVLDKLAHCGYLEPSILQRARADIAYANHQACLEMRYASARIRNAPTAQCPYAAPRPALDYPIEELLANMSASMYGLDDPARIMLPIAPYQIVDQITDPPTNMASALYRDGGNNYVVAYRGTEFSDIRNPLQDASWIWFAQNARLQAYMQQAAKALVTYRQRHPDGHFTLTGHSLGGFAAMVLGAYTHLPAAGFNAPAGAKMVATPTPAQIATNLPATPTADPDPDLTQAALGVLRQAALTPASARSKARGAAHPFTNSGYLVNFRMQADWVSVYRTGEDAKLGDRPYIGLVCTIREADLSLRDMSGVVSLLTSHDMGRTAAAMLLSPRAGGFFRPSQPFSWDVPCMTLE